MEFKLQYTDKETKARAGEITTAHGKIQTPIFMPVGTRGTVKAVHQHELKDEIKAQIILGKIGARATRDHFSGLDKPFLPRSKM